MEFNQHSWAKIWLHQNLNTKRQEAHGSHRSPEKPIKIKEYMSKVIIYIYYKICPAVREEKIFKFHEMFLCNFGNISLCEKELPFHLNKLKSSSHRAAFCQVWLKLAQWKNLWPFIDLTNTSFTQWCFVLCLVGISPLVLKKLIFKICQCFFAISVLHKY